MPDAAATDDLVGRTLSGKYRLLRRIGSGGMGAVYEAENARTRRRVAIKTLRGGEIDPGLAARFQREARVGARARHANLVDVLDLDDDDGLPYLVLELLEGATLRERLDARGAMSVDACCAVALPVLDALAAVHRAGVVHRDVKPENIFLVGADETPKLLDFGIARLAVPAEDEPSLTRTGVTLGTPLYMSPEQARAQADVDEQTDVWAMGVVLYEMLAGTSPFQRPSATAVLAAVLMDPVTPLDEAAPGVPRPVADVVHRALDRNRVQRYGSVEALRAALVAAREARPDAAAPDPRGVTPAPEPAARVRPLRWIVPIVAVAAAMGWLALGPTRAPAPTPTGRAVPSPRVGAASPAPSPSPTPVAPTPAPAPPVTALRRHPDGPPARRPPGVRGPVRAPPDAAPAPAQHRAAATADVPRIGSNGAPLLGL